MIFINKPISIFMVISVLEYSLCSATIHPFYNGTDNIETIDANDFIKNVLHSNRITVLECKFFASSGVKNMLKIDFCFYFSLCKLV